MKFSGLKLKSFAHYSFNAGENKGEAPTELTKAELSKSQNIENRGRGLTTRFGASVLNVNGSGYPSPIATNPVGSSVKFIKYGASITYDVLYTFGTSLYRNTASPTALRTGLTASLFYQYADAAEYFYVTNGTDPVYYYDPDRSTTATYTAGYDDPTAPTAIASAVGGSMATGTYEYYVTLVDDNTLTESNRTSTVLSVAVTGPTGSVALSGLPIDPESRSTHWVIYRKDPTGYYHYDLVKIAYNAGSPTYTDTTATTGSTAIAPDNNFKPDPSDCICLHGNIMIYAKGNVLTWSKNYRFQNVPTENRETLSDSSTKITKIISFRDVAVVWKTDAMYVIMGDLNRGNYIIRRISGVYGTRSPMTVTESPDGIFFLDNKKRPRFINSTDFSSEDLRESSDISFKYRDKFSDVAESSLEFCSAVLWETSAVSQYRLFVPASTSSNYANHCYVFDIGLSQRNGGQSAWFDFYLNSNVACSATGLIAGGQQAIITLDDYGLIWQQDVVDQFFDGDEYYREESDGTITIGATTVTITGATQAPVADQFKGMFLLLYDANTYEEIFRSRITTNSTTVFTVADTIPSLSTADPAVIVGGYLTYFATVPHPVNRSYRARSWKASVLFSSEFDSTQVQFFTWYDFCEAFNFTYSYFNTANPSLSPLTDNYTLEVGSLSARYDDAVYDTDKYGISLYGTDEFLLKSDYLWNHAAWGVVTRQPSQPFAYLGATLYYQVKGLTT